MMTEWFLGEDTEGSLYSHSPGKTPRCLLQGVFPSDIINGQQCNFSLISWKTHDKRWLLRGVAKSKNLGRQVVMRRLLICQNLGGRAPTLPTRFLHPCLHKCCHPIVCCYCNLSLRVGSSKAKLLSCLCLLARCSVLLRWSNAHPLANSDWHEIEVVFDWCRKFHMDVRRTFSITVQYRSSRGAMRRGGISRRW